MKKSILIIFILVGVSLLNAQVSEDDSLALVELYNATDGANWTENTNWLQPGYSVDDWYGIYTSEGRVYFINLFNNNLSGNIPPVIGNLTELTDLYLDENILSGPIPNEIENLTKLEKLSFSRNNLVDLIPPGIGKLSNLVELKLNNNQLMGPIPSQIGNLINLKTLLLYSNRLSEAVPKEICNLSKLEWMSLEFNDFSGPLPAGLKNMPMLDILGVGANNFTFADLEPLVGSSFTAFVYQPQYQIPLDTADIFRTAGDSLTLDITDHTIPDIDATNNQYKWWQDGYSITSYSSSPQLKLDTLKSSSESFYHCSVRNSDFPLLTLTTDSIYLWIKDIPTDISLSTSSIDENVPSGTFIGAFTVTDADQAEGHVFSFAVGDGIDDVDNHLFRLEGFELVIDTTPDYETKNVYKIRIRATDQDLNSIEKAFSISVNNLIEEEITGIEKKGPSTILLYPNPTQDYLVLEIPEQSSEIGVELYNVKGKLLLKDKNLAKRIIDFSSHPLGIYFLKISYKNQIIIRKVIKTK